MAVADRPDWDEYGLILAQAVAARADCTRRKVGAVLIGTDHRIISTGYNGSPPGGPSCLLGQCPRGRHYEKINRDSFPSTECACSAAWPCAEAAREYSSYDTGPGVCIALHAEQNAILYADPGRRQGSTMYVTCAPCDGCARLISGVGIVRVVTPESKLLTQVSSERKP